MYVCVCCLSDVKEFINIAIVCLSAWPRSSHREQTATINRARSLTARLFLPIRKREICGFRDCFRDLSPQKHVTREWLN